MIKTKTLICCNCGREFEKPYAEFKRRWKSGHRIFFCCRSCQTTTMNRLTPRGSAAHLNPANHRDELTPFRWFVARIRNRDGRATVSANYLKKLWDSQNGRCCLTGWYLVPPNSTVGWKNKKMPFNASLDRIDCSRRYTRGNIRFIALIANLARADFSDEDVIEFCKAVVKNIPTKR